MKFICTAKSKLVSPTASCALMFSANSFRNIYLLEPIMRLFYVAFVVTLLHFQLKNIVFDKALISPSI